jgi:hypothetical protein
MTMTALDINVDADVKFHRKYKWLGPLLLCLFLATTFVYLSEAEAIKEGLLAEDVSVEYTPSEGGGAAVAS